MFTRKPRFEELLDSLQLLFSLLVISPKIQNFLEEALYVGEIVRSVGAQGTRYRVCVIVIFGALGHGLSLMHWKQDLGSAFLAPKLGRFVMWPECPSQLCSHDYALGPPWGCFRARRTDSTNLRVIRLTTFFFRQANCIFGRQRRRRNKHTLCCSLAMHALVTICSEDGRYSGLGTDPLVAADMLAGKDLVAAWTWML